jgi:hypothetical protein
MCLFRFELTPNGGGERGTGAAGLSAAVIGFWGDCPAHQTGVFLKGQGEGSQNPSLTASGGS